MVVSDAGGRTGQINVGGSAMLSGTVGLSGWWPRVVSAVAGCN